MREHVHTHLSQPKEMSAYNWLLSCYIGSMCLIRYSIIQNALSVVYKSGYMWRTHVAPWSDVLLIIPPHEQPHKTDQTTAIGSFSWTELWNRMLLLLEYERIWIKNRIFEGDKPFTRLKGDFPGFPSIKDVTVSGCRTGIHFQLETVWLGLFNQFLPSRCLFGSLVFWGLCCLGLWYRFFPVYFAAHSVFCCGNWKLRTQNMSQLLY